MSKINDLHEKAMDFAARAFMARARGDAEQAAEFFESALDHETAAIAALDEYIEPTYSVLHRSAATLALDCKQYRKAERLAAKALAKEPPDDIAEELRDVLEQANFRRHFEVKGVELSDGFQCILEESRNQFVQHMQESLGQMEWGTPAYIIDAARISFRDPIDLDPASSELANETIRAKRIYTIETNGLVMPWKARNVWLNPPYRSDLLSAFVDKFLAEWSEGNFEEGAVMTNAVIGTRWAQKLASEASAICLLDKRVKFHRLNERGDYYTPKIGSLQGQAVWFFDSEDNPGRFRRAFGQLGRCFAA